MNCAVCEKPVGILVNGVCCSCNPFRRCLKDGCLGLMVNRPSPKWMNRFTCDKCGRNQSR